MRVAGGKHRRLASLTQGALARKVQHGADAQRGALGRIQGMRPEQLACPLFALADDAARLKQAVGAVDLGNIARLGSTDALMPRHVQAHGITVRVAADKIVDRRSHASPSCCLIASIMAHSMRFLKSSQPFS